VKILSRLPLVILILAFWPGSSFAQDLAGVEPLFMRWDPKTNQTDLYLLLYNNTDEVIRYAGQVEMSSGQFQKKVTFDLPFDLDKGERTIKVKIPMTTFGGGNYILIGGDYLVLSMRLFDAKSGALAAESSKYQLIIPSEQTSTGLPRPTKPWTLLFGAEPEEVAKILTMPFKRPDLSTLTPADLNQKVVWQALGDSAPWDKKLLKSVSPIAGAKGIDLRPTFQITFTEALEPASLSQERVKLVARGGKTKDQEVPLAFDLNKDQLLVRPKVDLEGLTQYRVSIDEGFVGVSGNHNKSRSWVFTTKEEEIVLEVSGTSPKNGEIDIPVKLAVSLLLSQPPNPKSIDKNKVRLMLGEQPVEGKLLLRGDQLMFLPKAPLFNETYYYFVLDGITDLKGRTLKQAYSFGFTTEKQHREIPLLEIASMYPANRTRDVGVDSEIWVRFKQKIDPATMTESAAILEADGQPVAGKWVLEDDRIRFKPEAELLYNKKYLVRVTEALKNLDGGGLRKEAGWAFITRNKVDYPDHLDENALIFSPSHEMDSYVLAKKGVLKIGVTTFEPIEQVDINGKMIKVPKETQIEFDFPYELSQRTTKFDVSVVTDAGLAKKSFTIHLGAKEEGASFKLINILAVSIIDNINNKAKDATHDAATKESITIVPQFTYRFSKEHAVGMKGIVLREKYTNKAYLSKEVSYTQLAFDWDWSDTWAGKMTNAIGWNDIRTQNDKLTLGTNKLLAETFWSITLDQPWDKETGLKQKLEIKNKNAVAKAAKIDDETDAQETNLTLTFKTNLWNLGTQFEVQNTQNQAVGKNQDFTAIKGSFKISDKWGPVSPSFKADTSIKDFNILNSTTGIKQKDVVTNYQLKATMTGWFKIVFGADYKLKKQTSNLVGSTYDVGTSTLNATYIW